MINYNHERPYWREWRLYPYVDYANDPLWGTLPAVKNNKLFEIDGYRFYFSDPISVLNQIQDIANMMEERAKANAAQ